MRKLRVESAKGFLKATHSWCVVSKYIACVQTVHWRVVVPRAIPKSQGPNSTTHRISWHLSPSLEPPYPHEFL